MLSLFRAITERVKALFATNAALELESEFLARAAESKAELLRQAARYDEEGLHGIAEHIRRQAETLSIQRPLASVLPAIEHLLDGQNSTSVAALPPTGNDMPEDTAPKQLPQPTSKKKGR